MSEVSGMDLGPFFDQWVFVEDRPDRYPESGTPAIDA